MLLLRLMRRPFFWIIALAIAVFAIAPLIGNNVGLRESLLLDALYIMLASNLNLMLGYAGYINFGSIVFFGLGGYICVWLVNSYNWTLGPEPARCRRLRERVVARFRARHPAAARRLFRPFHHRHRRSRAGLRRKFHAVGRIVRHLSVERDIQAAGRGLAGAVDHLFHHGRA